jgi:hypothetical protein
MIAFEEFSFLLFEFQAVLEFFSLELEPNRF